jgi:hypothetical protein
MQFEELIAVKDKYRDEFFQHADVTAVGIGLLNDQNGALTEKIGIIVYHRNPTAEFEKKAAHIAGDFAVQIRQGDFKDPAEERRKSVEAATLAGPEAAENRRALSSNPREKKFEPMIGGISISPDYLFSMGSGTLGIAVRAQDGSAMILSNEHVMCFGNVKVGDDISQPDRTVFGDLAAHLVAWQKGNITYQSVSYGVDAAIAKPTNHRTATIGQIYNLPTPVGVLRPALNMKVTKSGITTDITNGVIDGFYDVKTPDMKNQIGIRTGTANDFSAPGDSGSAVIDTASNRMVGLLWGGSDEVKPRVSLASPIIPILDLFKCTY